ncbi:hypothetical protein, partial [Burkholderia ubonensis]|uniref:hypothetical protein n=1 Tax=Burkholderia ubonensis TaxID=101571 RepID=UPI001E3C9234
THGPIEHPRCHHLDYAKAGVDMHHAVAAAILDVSNLDAATIQRMPTIMDFNFLPDMGRMNASLRRGARIGCSPVLCAPGNGPPRS